MVVKHCCVPCGQDRPQRSRPEASTKVQTGKFETILAVRMTTSDPVEDTSRPGGVLGRLVSILVLLQGLSVDNVQHGSGTVETIWQRLVEPSVDDNERDSGSSSLGASHELLSEYGFRECTGACSGLVVRLGEGSTLGPLVDLLRKLLGEDGASEVNRPNGTIETPELPRPTRISAETVTRLTKMVHVVSAMRIVLDCLEHADLYFSLEGALAIVSVAIITLDYGRDVYSKRRDAGIRHRERLRQLCILLQLEIVKVLLMLSRRYTEIFDKVHTGGSLAKLLVRVWVESDEDAVPVSWVQDSTSEVTRRESSLLQSVMSLMGSSLSLRFGKDAKEENADQPARTTDVDDDDDVARRDGTVGHVTKDDTHDPEGSRDNLDMEEIDEKNDASLAEGGAHASGGASDASLDIQSRVERDNAGLSSSHSVRRSKNLYDADHPLQSLSALLALLLRFTVPAFKAGLRDIISPTGSLSSKVLLETLSKRMASSESSRLLMHVLLQDNSAFMNYCMTRTDVDMLVIPLLEKLYTTADKETTSMDEMYIMVILLLVLTGDKAFVMSANGSVVKDQDIAWYTTRNIKGIRLDALMLLVLLHVGLVSTYSPSRRDVYLHTHALATIANMAPTMADLHPVACQRLVGVLEKLGTTEDRIKGGSEVAMDRDVLRLIQEFQSVIFEVINAIISNCLQSNVSLVYAMLHKRSVIDRFVNREGELKELSENACAVVEYFGGLLYADEAPDFRTNPSGNHSANQLSTEQIDPSKRHPPHPPPPSSLSVERIQEIISNGMSSFQPDQLPFATSELRFGFEEEADSALFFLPYIDDMILSLIL